MSYSCVDYVASIIRKHNSRVINNDLNAIASSNERSTGTVYATAETRKNAHSREQIAGTELSTELGFYNKVHAPL